MKILDVNLLIYAVNRDAPQHAKAKVWLENSLVEAEPMGFSWVVILAVTVQLGLFIGQERGNLLMAAMTGNRG